jgi:starch phosphorylase
MKVTSFTVLPDTPEALDPLKEIAYNMWFSWNHEARELFMRLDQEYWEKSYQSPINMLCMLPLHRLQEAAQDQDFLAQVNGVYQNFQKYLNAKPWFEKKFGKRKKPFIAYVSLEYGIDEGLPLYSGGLGILAGDHMKSASDLGIPLVGIGLLYRQGYFKQYLNADGWQMESYPENNRYRMPLSLERDAAGKPLLIDLSDVNIPAKFQVWRVDIGRIPLYLLDANIPSNAIEHQVITMQLYGGDRDLRIRQELLLGIGGLRALQALGLSPTVCHINEGHAAFLTLERIRQYMEAGGLSFQEAFEICWSSNVFTTHTPVPAGNERFNPSLMQKHLGGYVEKLGLSWNEFLAMGREDPANQGEEFCMTVLALKMCARSNGVSRLHGSVSRKMWKNLWPGLNQEDIPITSITNGIHGRSWVSHEQANLFQKHLGEAFIDEPLNVDSWKGIDTIPDTDLWELRDIRREKLVNFARKRLRVQFARRKLSPSEINIADEVLDPKALTIGFARRFATYKRAYLLLREPERLARILLDAKQPVQLIIAGKAHPADNAGKEMIRQIIHFTRDEKFRHKIVFLEDYDLTVARYMVQGVDVWLNTPRRPMEASGTSGMKAAANGVLNLSVLDGWWPEAYASGTGWPIGWGEEYDDHDYQDAVEGHLLYDTLEREVMPLFYKRDAEGIPRAWVKNIKTTLKRLGFAFSSNRMVAEYTDRCYLNADRDCGNLKAREYTLAREMAGWRRKIRSNWGKIRVINLNTDFGGEFLRTGDEVGIVAEINLGELSPDDVAIELYHGPVDDREVITSGLIEKMEVQGSSNGIHAYRGTMVCQYAGRYGFALRVVPGHYALPHHLIPGLILWA